MILLSIILGFAIGLAQIAFTGIITDAVLTDSPKKNIVPLTVKLLLYGFGITAAMLTDKVDMLFLGVGFGAGMLFGCIGYILFKSVSAKKQCAKAEEKEEKNEKSDKE